jgi:phosphonate transport system substrate-binding protein
MTGAPYRLGAVVYHPKVEQIWREFAAWFADQGLALAPRYYDSYEQQIEDLLDGSLDTAWNTNLAHVRVLQRTGGTARALAMRDTDRGWRSHLVARAGSGIRRLEDLAGRRVGFGDADSPQAHILPVHALRAEGIARLGDPGALDVVWTSPPFHHCCFSVREDGGEPHQRFRELLFGMDVTDPRLCEPMELEYVNRWVEFDPAGYRDLIAAVEAGPVVVGHGVSG